MPTAHSAPDTRPAASPPRQAGKAALHDLASLAELVTHLKGRFVNVEAGRLDHEINHALQLIGDFAGVDRSYVFQVYGETMANTHEWCVPGIESQLDALQDLPVAELWEQARSLGLRLVRDLVTQIGGTAALATGASGSRITVRFR